MRVDVARWPTKPLISVVMPVYNTDPRWLRAAIRSAQSQLYPNWELCISDDASGAKDVRVFLLDFARRDPRNSRLPARAQRQHFGHLERRAVAESSLS
jgi:O-antigen biosynthesis protein